MSKARILIVEDDLDLREALYDTLDLAGFEVYQAESGEAALQLLNKTSVDMVVSDVNMGAMNGHELLARLNQQYPSLPVLLMTAYADVNSAVNAMRSGAVDYLVKPFKPQTLVESVKRYAGSVGALSDQQPIAEEPSSKELLALARKVAVTEFTVLISGESGTGKEVLARYIHANSSCADGPFVAINCAAIPENMLEATLFGHEKGAFTGAYSSNPGKFEQANGGTILLDEVSEMAPGLQAKLLRVLQEREVERVGGKKVIPLNVRVIATTNRDLLKYVGEGKFREDLYYRLSVFPLQWQPLRERQSDIVPLAERLLAHHGQKMNKSRVTLSQQAKRSLLEYSWPGNVRELDNVIQRALILQRDDQVTTGDLMLSGTISVTKSSVVSVSSDVVEETAASAAGLEKGMKNHEYQLIVDALKLERGRKKQAAEKLGISPRTLRYKLAKMRESGFDLDAALGY